MKKFTVKNYKGNLLESVKKFQETHKDMRIVEAYEDAGVLGIGAEPFPATDLPPPDLPAEPQTSPSDAVAETLPEDPLFAFGCRLLMFGVKAHLWHLNCTNHGQHLALKELYEACDDAGDALLEAEIGIVNAPIDHFDFDLHGMDLNFSADSINEIVEIKTAADALTQNGYGNGINNVLDDFAATCNSVIYKLRRLA